MLLGAFMSKEPLCCGQRPPGPCHQWPQP